MESFRIGDFVIDDAVCRALGWDKEIFGRYGEQMPERFKSLLVTANQVIGYIQRSIGQDVIDLMTIDERNLAIVTIDYYNEVYKFREDHNFYDTRINSDKRAALTIRAIMKHQPIIISQDFPDYVHKKVEANATLCFRFILIAVGVLPKNIPKKIRKDLLYCIQFHHHIRPEILYMMVSFLRLAFSGWRWCNALHLWAQGLSNSLLPRTP